MNYKGLFLSIVFLACLGNLQAVELFYQYSQFFAPEGGTYIETCLNIPTQSLELKENASGKLQGAVDVTIIFTDEAGEIKAYDKYNMLSPEFADKSEAQSALIDLKRFVLPPGNYSMEITYKDANAEAEASVVNTKVEVAFDKFAVEIADINLLEEFGPAEESDPFFRNGMRLVPYVLGYYPSDLERLKFYTEVYNTNTSLGQDAMYLVNYYITRHGDGEPTSGKKGFMKMNAAPVNIVLAEMDISDLGSGNYNLIVEVRNKQNELLQKKGVFFQRNNRLEAKSITELDEVDIEGTFVDKLDAERIDYCLGALIPVVENHQATYIDNLREAPGLELKSKKQYLYNYWVQIDPHFPQESFAEYMKVVDAVETAYASRIRNGFETDRGLIFLKYGKPNFVDIQAGVSNSHQPYEIWHFESLQNQTNVRFIFYDPDLSSNDYELIHSDLRGEVNNPSWQAIVFSKIDPSLRQDVDFQERNSSNSSDRIIGERPSRDFADEIIKDDF